jgi:hypothetical protein
MKTEPHLAAMKSGNRLCVVNTRGPASIIVGAWLIFASAQSIADPPATNGDRMVETSPASMIWGPVSHGLQLSAFPVMKTFSLGDPIRLAVVTTNVTTEPISLTVIFPGSDHRYDLKFVVTDDHGRRVPFTQLGGVLDGEPSAVSGVAGIIVSPRGAVKDTVGLDERFELGTTGVFFVTVRRLIPDDMSKLIRNVPFLDSLEMSPFSGSVFCW